MTSEFNVDSAESIRHTEIVMRASPFESSNPPLYDVTVPPFFAPANGYRHASSPVPSSSRDGSAERGALSRPHKPALAGPLTGKAPFRLWYNNDTTNIMSVDSPFHKRGEPLTDEAIFGSIDEVADKGVDAYALSPGLGHVPFWKSEVYPDHFQWWMKKTGLEPDAYGRYLLDGGDLVRALVERCRHHGMAPFVSLRMNDVHRLENVGKKTPESIWVSRFYEENPDLLLEPDHPGRRPKGYYHLRGQNWAKPAVRGANWPISPSCA